MVAVRGSFLRHCCTKTAMDSKRKWLYRGLDGFLHTRSR